ncbi:MAG: hypothetical protein ACRD98_02605 [Nitrososphaera sp.]
MRVFAAAIVPATLVMKHAAAVKRAEDDAAAVLMSHVRFEGGRRIGYRREIGPLKPRQPAFHTDAR